MVWGVGNGFFFVFTGLVVVGVGRDVEVAGVFFVELVNKSFGFVAAAGVLARVADGRADRRPARLHRTGPADARVLARKTPATPPTKEPNRCQSYFKKKTDSFVPLSTPRVVGETRLKKK